MRLHSITLANFKSISGEVEIPIGRITYLVGPNGAGKSNILDGLQKIASMILNGKHVPKPDEFFDDSDENDIRLGATFELSEKERLAFFKYWTGSEDVDRSGSHPDRPFRLLKYVATIDLTTTNRKEISMSTGRGRFELFACLRRVGNQFALDSRSMEAAVDKNTPLPPLHSRLRDDPTSTSDLFGILDPSLLTAIGALFRGMKVVGSDREIPPAVTARESGEISPAGQNLPNEFNDLPRAEQDEFDRRMDPVTHGDPLGVEPRTIGSDLLLEAREEGLTRKARHTDLGSGQLQTLILGWQVYRQEGAVIVIEEPELHLHAERQRQMLRLIRDKSKEDGTQFIIETHSPVFLGVGSDERTVLVTKDASRSRIAEIDRANVGLIRHELGITHADGIRPANILFAVGLSGVAVFAPLLRAASPGHARSTMVYTLPVGYDPLDLKMLIRYLGAEGRRMFVVLDGSDEARRQVGDLEKDGLLAGNWHFLAESLGSELDNDLIARAACDMAAASGCDLLLTADELGASMKDGRPAVDVLRERWDERQCDVLDESELAERIVGLLGGRIPPGIGAALQAAVAHFGGADAGRSKQRAARDPKAGP